jgi:Domain of unknown function (DUF4440)
MGLTAFLSTLLIASVLNATNGTTGQKKATGTSKVASSSSSRPARTQQTPAPKNANKNSSKDSNKESKAATNNAYVAPLDNSKAGLQAVEVDLITGLEKDGIEAGLKKNRNWFQSYLADDLTGTSANGVSENKEKLMARALDPANMVESRTCDELTVRPYGEDVMIATGKVSEKGKSNNADYNVQRTFIHVWVNRLGQWQQVAIQESPAQPGAAQSQTAMPARSQTESRDAVAPPPAQDKP